MPYIEDAKRNSLEITHHSTNQGELNYLLSITALDYLDRHGLSYATLNDILGAFTGAGEEFYRRIVAPYEDKKRIEHGDLSQYKYWTKQIEEM